MKRSATIEQWTEYLNRGKRKGTVKLKVPLPKHQNLIAYLLRSAPLEVKLVDLCCGRGFGKSFLAIFIATMVLDLGPNEIGLFLEPDKKRVDRVFLKKWKQIVPRALYTINKGEQCIIWNRTGAPLYYGGRNITGSQEVMDDGQLGQDATFIISDEEAVRCSYDMYTNNLACIREPSDIRFYLTLSTPKVGQYKRLVTSRGHKLFRGKSDDNIYMPPGTVDGWREKMSVERAKRELDGEFISLEGKIWKDAFYEKWDADDPEKQSTDCAWPDGNRNDKHTSFQEGEPWWLFADLGGVTGAYVVMQQAVARHNGRDIFDGEPLWVAVADLCPINNASALRAFRKLKKLYGNPVSVVAGKDVNAVSGTEGRTVAFYVKSIFGHGVRIYPCSETKYNKLMQHDQFQYLLKDTFGRRRFTIARDFVELEPESVRGVQQMLNEDEWPPLDKRRASDTLPKNRENVVQHVRDAILMGTVMLMAQPDWLQNNENAA